MSLTRAQLESKGFALRTPPGRIILEVPAEVGWDDLGIDERAEILKTFGFRPELRIEEKSKKVIAGTLYQFSQ